jgi:cytochrome c biogenesis protein CcmG/thiol:disulfide interchange protein DsbE
MSVRTPRPPAPATARPAPGRARRYRRALVASAAVAVVVAVLIAVLATRSTPPGAIATTSLGGKPAPGISGRAIVGGGRVSLAALRGRDVVVDFFASWCQPCQDEAAALETFLFAHRAEHVAILGVDIDDSASNARSFLQQTGATWPAVEDPGGSASIATAYGVADPPESFLVAPDGRVVGYIVGQDTVSLLDHLLADATARS